MNHALLVTALAAVSLAGAEVRLADLVVVAESHPTAIDWKWDDRLGSRQGVGELDTATAAGLGLRWGWGSPGRPHLLTAGADLLWERADWDGAEIAGPMLRLGGGYAYALSDRWLLQAGPDLAYGRQRFTRASAVSGDLDLEGSAVQAGLGAGLRCSFGLHWSLAATAGWQIGRLRLSGDGAELAVDAAGVRCGLVLACTLDPRPRLLE